MRLKLKCIIIIALALNKRSSLLAQIKRRRSSSVCRMCVLPFIPRKCRTSSQRSKQTMRASTYLTGALTHVLCTHLALERSQTLSSVIRSCSVPTLRALRATWRFISYDDARWQTKTSAPSAAPAAALLVDNDDDNAI